jgi:hypothetical protein
MKRAALALVLCLAMPAPAIAQVDDTSDDSASACPQDPHPNWDQSAGADPHCWERVQAGSDGSDQTATDQQNADQQTADQQNAAQPDQDRPLLDDDMLHPSDTELEAPAPP